MPSLVEMKVSGMSGFAVPRTKAVSCTVKLKRVITVMRKNSCVTCQTTTALGKLKNLRYVFQLCKHRRLHSKSNGVKRT